MALGEDICYSWICKGEVIYVDKGNGLDMWDRICFTTALARLKLYAELEKLEKQNPGISVTVIGIDKPERSNASSTEGRVGSLQALQKLDRTTCWIHSTTMASKN